ncbi:aldo/keto reductase [Tenacibaculum ovolyticum]|uniref:aldo/keto reductase n=1 Tax=Tenacibaculum ovolyticum TaxID=104270 RepID=UPI001F4633D8|nr:aldo/keto reductase [Tenacibaculum ovolyticum]
MIHKIILGTVQLGLDYGVNNTKGKPSLEEAFDILTIAYDSGIRILDTAEAYGDSQKVIGEFHRLFPQKKFNIVTKLSANKKLRKDQFLAHIKNNCKILCCDSLYGYMFHNYESFKDNINLYETILEAKKIGIIKKVGVSLYDNQEIEDIITNYPEFDLIQIPFNLLDNEYLRKPILDKAKQNNIEVHTRSVFLQGLFFKEIDKLSANIFPLEVYIKKLKEISFSNNIKIESLALQYALQKNYIDYVLIGVDTPEQLKTNILNSKNCLMIPHELIDSIHVKEKKMLNPSNWN